MLLLWWRPRIRNSWHKNCICRLAVIAYSLLLWLLLNRCKSLLVDHPKGTKSCLIFCWNTDMEPTRLNSRTKEWRWQRWLNRERNKWGCKNLTFIRMRLKIKWGCCLIATFYKILLTKSRKRNLFIRLPQVLCCTEYAENQRCCREIILWFTSLKLLFSFEMYIICWIVEIFRTCDRQKLYWIELSLLALIGQIEVCS